MEKVADPASIAPTANPDAVSPHSEAFQAVIRHLLGIHPRFSSAQSQSLDSAYPRTDTPEGGIAPVGGEPC